MLSPLQAPVSPTARADLDVATSEGVPRSALAGLKSPWSAPGPCQNDTSPAWYPPLPSGTTTHTPPGLFPSGLFKIKVSPSSHSHSLKAWSSVETGQACAPGKAVGSSPGPWNTLTQEFPHLQGGGVAGGEYFFLNEILMGTLIHKIPKKAALVKTRTERLAFMHLTSYLLCLPATVPGHPRSP